MEYKLEKASASLGKKPFNCMLHCIRPVLVHLGSDQRIQQTNHSSFKNKFHFYSHEKCITCKQFKAIYHHKTHDTTIMHYFLILSNKCPAFFH